jgi:hypothetical protein
MEMEISNKNNNIGGCGEKKRKEKGKYIADLRKDKEGREIINKVLEEANNKSLGREILFKDIVLMAFTKITSKDIEKLQENSLTEMERVERMLAEHNKKNNSSISLGEFLVRKLNLI